MLVACERDYYESLPQAMEHTISLFVKDVLKALVVRKKLKVGGCFAPVWIEMTITLQLFIHPIVSVIDATRHLAIPYNNIFRNSCQNIPGELFVWCHCSSLSVSLNRCVIFGFVREFVELQRTDSSSEGALCDGWYSPQSCLCGADRASFQSTVIDPIANVGYDHLLIKSLLHHQLSLLLKIKT